MAKRVKPFYITSIFNHNLSLSYTKEEFICGVYLSGFNFMYLRQKK